MEFVCRQCQQDNCFGCTDARCACCGTGQDDDSAVAYSGGQRVTVR